MSGIFGVVSRDDCVKEVYYGTDYHSHLGTSFGGMAVYNGQGIQYKIHNISEHSFRSQFGDFVRQAKGERSIGVISDYEPQPLVIDSRLGNYAIMHVGKITNLQELVEKAHKKGVHFSEMSGGFVNPTELIATLINQGKNLEDGIEIMQNTIQGSSSLALLTKDGIYIARDKYGRTPMVIGRKDNSMAVTMETCALPTLDFEFERFLGHGEIGILTERGYEQLKKPEEKMQICAFLWIYYGFPTSKFEGINVEQVRNRFGEKLAFRDQLDVDFVSEIPDSGIGCGQGYANASKFPHKRVFAKYTWGRSFMSQDQEIRDLVAKMKLIPIEENIQGSRFVLCEDSIVRGTQLNKKIKVLFKNKAKEVHVRPSCPPLIFPCKYLNFSRSRAADDLAAIKAIKVLKGIPEFTRVNLPYPFDINPFTNPDSKEFSDMVEVIRKNLGATNLRYQRLDDMVEAIGLERDKLCLGCWV